MSRMRSVQDTFVLYYSAEDNCWVAHSLRTDQIGTGDRIVDALADGIKAVEQVKKAAGKDPSLAVFREAPEEVQRICKKARKLPREIYEIAYKQVHGQWPEELPFEIRPTNTKQSFKADLQEA